MPVVVPGLVAHRVVPGVRAQAPRRDELPSGLGLGRRRQHELSVGVEEAAEPLALVVGGVGQHAVLAVAERAVVVHLPRHVALAAHEPAAPAEHERPARGGRGEPVRPDRLERGAAHEHLVHAGRAGELLEALHLHEVLEPVEEVARVGEPALGEVAVEHGARHGELDVVPRPRTRRAVARGVHLPGVQDHRPGHVGGAAVAVVELERTVREQDRAHLHARVPGEREYRRRHLGRLVGLGKPVLRADRVGDAVEDGVRDHAHARSRNRLERRPRLRAVEREHRRRHLRGQVGARAAVLHADGVGDVGEHRPLYRPHGHQNSTSLRSSRAAIAWSTYCFVA